MIYFFLYQNRNILVFLLLIFISIASSLNGTTSTTGYKLVDLLFMPTTNKIQTMIASFSERIDNIVRLDQKLAETEELQKELASLEHQYLKTTVLLNKYLNFKIHKAFFQFLKLEKVPVVSAQIIYRNIRLHNGVLLLNKGLRHGIRINMPVIAFKQIATKSLNTKKHKKKWIKIAVGSIERAHAYSSKILLLTASESVVHAQLASSLNTGFVQGQSSYFHHSQAMLTHLDKNTPFNFQEEVWTTGGSSIFPSGIHIGRAIKKRPFLNDETQKFEIQTYLNMAELEQVFVILKQSPLLVPELQ